MAIGIHGVHELMQDLDEAVQRAITYFGGIADIIRNIFMPIHNYVTTTSRLTTGFHGRIGSTSFINLTIYQTRMKTVTQWNKSNVVSRLDSSQRCQKNAIFMHHSNSYNLYRFSISSLAGVHMSLAICVAAKYNEATSH